jgi:hypothetical protein
MPPVPPHPHPCRAHVVGARGILQISVCTCLPASARLRLRFVAPFHQRRSLQKNAPGPQFRSNVNERTTGIAASTCLPSIAIRTLPPSGRLSRISRFVACSGYLFGSLR